jgi:hypothetical protein
MDLPRFLWPSMMVWQTRGGVVVMDLSIFWPTDNSNRVLCGLFLKVSGEKLIYHDSLSL